MSKISKMYSFACDKQDVSELLKNTELIEKYIKNNSMAIQHYTNQRIRSEGLEREGLVIEALVKLRALNEYDKSQFKLIKKKLDVIRINELNQINREK